MIVSDVFRELPFFSYATTVRWCVPADNDTDVDIRDPLVVYFATKSTYSRTAVTDVPLEGVDAATTETGEPTVEPEVGVQILTPALAGALQEIVVNEMLFFATLFNTSTVAIVSV